jgi:hypothetical protein
MKMLGKNRRPTSSKSGRGVRAGLASRTSTTLRAVHSAGISRTGRGVRLPSAALVWLRLPEPISPLSSRNPQRLVKFLALLDFGHCCGLKSALRPVFILATFVFVLLTALDAQAQRWGRRGWGDDFESPTSTEGGDMVDPNTLRTAREVASHSSGTPTWVNEPAFGRDVLTFVRIIYRRNPDPGLSYSAGHWITDFPDSDLNLSFRVQQATSIRTDPNGRVMKLTNPDLFDYPWIYMVEPGRLYLTDEEAQILRKYLLNGGALMADDFWGELQWQGFADQIKKVFKDRDFVDIPMTNELFHCVFDLKPPLNKLQTPSIHHITSQYSPGYHSTEWTWEHHDGEECKEMHVRGLYDDKGRLMVIATHNCDNGDSWEREGEDDFFFHNFSEKRGYPLGINILFYLMTH